MTGKSAFLSAPIVEALRPWFEKQLSMISSGSTLATDMRYAIAHWEASPGSSMTAGSS